MSEILQTNIFFFITSVAVVLVTILVGIAFFYVVSILRNIKDISDRAKRGSEVLGRDLIDLRSAVKKEGARTKHLYDFFIRRFGETKRRAGQENPRKRKPINSSSNNR